MGAVHFRGGRGGRYRYDERMTTTKVARKQVKAGRAKSLGALLTQAVDEKVRRGELHEVLDAMDEALGSPRAADSACVRQVLAR